MTALVLGGVIIGAQSSMAAPAKPKLSPGCQRVNSADISGVTGGVGFNELFYRGEKITFSAGAPYDGDPLILVGAIGGLTGPNAVSAPFPGSVTLSIAKKGTFVVQAAVTDSSGVAQGATFEATCTPAS